MAKYQDPWDDKTGMELKLVFHLSTTIALAHYVHYAVSVQKVM
jgi:hypothetical protein